MSLCCFLSSLHNSSPRISGIIISEITNSGLYSGMIVNASFRWNTFVQYILLIMSATDSCVIHRYPPQSESAGVRRSTSYVRFRIFRVREQVHCLGSVFLTLFAQCCQMCLTETLAVFRERYLDNRTLIFHTRQINLTFMQPH